MEHASQALMTSGGIRKRAEVSVSSCSGKISRTGEQYKGPWELLPDEMVVSIFNLLSNNDLLACRAVCKRFGRVIGESVLLDKAKDFWRQFYQPPGPALFSRDRYKQVLRPWLEAFVTAQQQLADDASDDLRHLQLSDSKEETEKQASSEQTEQEQAVKSSQVKQLDRLIEHREFPKVLFLIQAKTLQNAESLYFQKMSSHCCAAIVKTVYFSPDGRGLLIPFEKTIHFMALDENSNVIRQYDKSYSSNVEKLHFSPNGHSLLICFNHSIMIMGLGGADWVQKGEIRWNHFRHQVCFSHDSDSLAAVFPDFIRIMGHDEKGNWVKNARIFLHYTKAICFSPNGSSLAISNENDVWIMNRDEKGDWVQKMMIPCRIFSLVRSVCFSPDGGSLAISGRKSHQTPGCVLFMRSDGTGHWFHDFVIRCDFRCSISFSPDGRNLLLENSDFCIRRSEVISLGWAGGRVFSNTPFLHNKDAACFSPDGGSFARGLENATRVMGFDKNNWVERAFIPNTGKAKLWSVESICFSPDSRSLVILSSNHYSDFRNPESQIKIYAIKTGAKVLTGQDNRFLNAFFSP